MPFGHCSLEAGESVSQGVRIGRISNAYLHAVLIIRDAVGCYWRMMALKISATEFDNDA